MTLLSCPRCGNNRLEFPDGDAEAVRCQSCGESLGTLAELKKRVGDEVTNRRKKR